MSRILIADDDRSIAELISDALTDEGFDTDIVSDGDEALRRAQNGAYSLILLDIMMPNTDGLEVCRRIRDTVSCPIIFVSAKNRTIDTLLGLGMGADDYIAKPFVLDELVARVKAHIRRDNRSGAQATSAGVLRSGEIEIRKDTYEAYKSGERIALSTREFQLLQFLMENEGKVLSRDQIFNAVWGQGYGDVGTVAVNIKNLRNKIDIEGKYIKTVWGVGYRFAPPQG